MNETNTVRAKANEKNRLCRLWESMNPYVMISKTWLDERLSYYDEQLLAIKRKGKEDFKNETKGGSS
jgi:hypothetical protein